MSRTRKPTPEPMYPTFAVGESDSNNETTRVAAVTEPKSDEHKLMEMIWRMLSNTERPNPKPEIPDILERLQQLLRESVPNALEQTFRPLFDGQWQRQRQPPRLRQQRRDWTELICFSCGQLEHRAMRCPDFNGTLPFTQPGWQTVKRLGGVTMIPPQAITDRRRAENDGWSGRAGPPLGSVSTLGPGPRRGDSIDWSPTTDSDSWRYCVCWTAQSGTYAGLPYFDSINWTGFGWGHS